MREAKQENTKAKRQPLSRRIRINSNALILVLIGLICTIGLLYLIEFNKISTMGILIDDLKNERDRLIIENEVWNMRIADIKSLDVIQNQDVVQRMVPISDITYLDKE